MCPHHRKTVEQLQKCLWITLLFIIAYQNVATHAKSNMYEQ